MPKLSIGFLASMAVPRFGVSPFCGGQFLGAPSRELTCMLRSPKGRSRRISATSVRRPHADPRKKKRALQKLTRTPRSSHRRFGSRKGEKSRPALDARTRSAAETRIEAKRCDPHAPVHKETSRKTGNPKPKVNTFRAQNRRGTQENCQKPRRKSAPKSRKRNNLNEKVRQNRSKIAKNLDEKVRQNRAKNAKKWAKKVDFLNAHQ